MTTMANEQTEATYRTNQPIDDEHDMMTTSTNVTKRPEISKVGTTAITMCQHVSVIQCAIYCLHDVDYGNCASFQFDTDVYTQKHVSHNTSDHRGVTFEKSKDF